MFVARLDASSACGGKEQGSYSVERKLQTRLQIAAERVIWVCAFRGDELSGSGWEEALHPKYDEDLWDDLMNFKYQNS